MFLSILTHDQFDTVGKFGWWFTEMLVPWFVARVTDVMNLILAHPALLIICVGFPVVGFAVALLRRLHSM